MSPARLAGFSPLLVLLVALLAPCSRAQTIPSDPGLELGFKPFGSFDGGEIDTVNLMSRSLNLHIPMASYPQRGGRLSLSFSVIYKWPLLRSRLEQCIANPRAQCTYWTFVPWSGLQVVEDSIPGSPTLISPSFSIGLPDGQTTLGVSTGAGAGVTVDGSGIIATYGGECTPGVQFYPWTVRDKVGNVYTYPCNGTVTAQDLNGNQISTAPTSGTYTDTIGRTVTNPYPFNLQLPTTTNTTGCTGSLPTSAAYLWTIPAINGGTATLKICTATVNASLPHCSINGTTRCDDSQTTTTMIQSIVLPNSTAWTFQYDSASAPGVGGPNYGDLIGITLPTGGTISYVWQTPNLVCFSSPFERVLQSRTTNANDGSGPHTTTYSATDVGTGNFPQLQTTALDPLGNQSVHTFTALTGNSCDYYETLAQYYQGTQTLLKTVLTQYHYDSFNSNAVQGGGKALNVMPTSITTTWPNGQTSQVQNDYLFDVPLNGQSVADTTYGNVVAHREYDYGTNAPGGLLRQTATTFQYQNSSAYKANNLVSLPATVIITDGGGVQQAQTTYGYDENNGSPQGAFGNQTSVTRWLSGGTSPKSQIVFNSQGMPYKSVDPKSNTTIFTFDSTGAYLSQVQYPTTGAIQHIVQYSFDTNTGLRLMDKDQNSNTTTYKYNDPLSRLTEVDSPDGGQTLISYGDNTPTPSVTTSRKLDNSGRYVTNTATMDGLGHIIETLLTPDPDCASGDRADTTYDGLGRVYTVSNPYCTPSDPTYGLTTYAYDALGRTTQVTHPDNSTILTTYTGRATQVQDEGNGSRRVSRISQVDGLGRLASVCEVTSASQLGSTGTPAACPQDISATGFLTTYGYDTLGDLTSSSQSGLNSRTFYYDSLARLTSATNPESGTITYSYDSNGNLITKTDARGITTCFGNWNGTSCDGTGYDALNRVTQKTYSDGTLTAYFAYEQTSSWGVTLTNTVGRLTEQWTGTSCCATGGAEIFSYDQMGRPLLNEQYTPAVGYVPVNYTYDLAGDIATFTNGGGETFSYTTNGVARLTTLTSSLSDSNHPGTLFSAPRYNAAGSMLTASLGGVITETRTYDSRLRLASISDGSNYSLTIPSAGGYAPNGDILAANDGVNGNWTYSYDDFNRLSGSNQNSGQSVYSYAYDRFGNRWQQNGPYSMELSFSGANNRMDGYSYDAAGNLLSDGSHSYAYDAENRITQVDGGSTAAYVYDAEGRRVQKTTSSGTASYIYDLAGHEVVQYGPTCSPCRDEIYAGGRHLATYNNSTTYFIHPDWLGTERARSNVNGGVCETITSLPFGDDMNTSGSCSDASPMHFTGKQRDNETASHSGGTDGLDFFEARYNSSNLGRFMSPDPDNAGADVLAPQSWNAYSYVLNNPLADIDPSGLDCIYVDNDTGKQTGFDRGDCDNSTEEKANTGYYVNGTVDISSIRGDNNTLIYTFTPSDGLPFPQIGNQCVGTCPDTSVTVTATPPGTPTMSAARPLFELSEWGREHQTLFKISLLAGSLAGLPPEYCGPPSAQAEAPSTDPTDSTKNTEGQKRADAYQMGQNGGVTDAKGNRAPLQYRNNKTVSPNPQGARASETVVAAAGGVTLGSNAGQCLANATRH